MKSKITMSIRLLGSGHEHKKNNFKRVSKSTFILLGILLTMFNNSILANNLSHKQNNQESNASEMAFVSKSNNTKFTKPVVAVESDTIISMNAYYVKTIEEVIAEDNKIIESEIENNTTSEVVRTMKKVIKQDNQIIESNITVGFPIRS